MKYKLLIFDLDNTIFNYDKAENFALDKTLKTFGCPVTEGMKISYRDINEQTWKRFERGEITSEDLRVMRFSRFAEVHGLEWDAGEVSRKYLENLGLGGFLIDGAEKLLFELQKDFHLASVTNGISDVQRARLKNSTLKGMFKPLIISDEVGAAKPDPRIFEILMEEAGDYRKEEILMIGDSLTSDIAGAAAAGIPNCWYNPDGLPADDKIIPDFEIKSLEEVKSVVYGRA